MVSDWVIVEEKTIDPNRWRDSQCSLPLYPDFQIGDSHPIFSFPVMIFYRSPEDNF